MRKFANLILVIALLALALGLLLVTNAQTENQGKPEPSQGMNIELSKEDIPRLVEIIRIWKLVDELELKDQQLVEFLPRFKELDNLKSVYYRDRHNSVSKLRKLLEGNSSEKDLKSAVDEFKKLEMGFYQKYSELDNALNSNLTVKQQAEFIVFEDKYRDDMRNLIRKLRDLSNLREQKARTQSAPTRP